MSNIIQKELKEELSNIIKKSLNVKDDTQLENLKREYVLLEYIVNCINSIPFLKKEEKKIVNSMKQTFNELQENMEDIHYDEFINKYIQNLDSNINYNTKVFNKYKEHYNLIYQILISLNNIYNDISLKKNIIDIIVEEETNREELFSIYWPENEYKEIFTKQLIEDTIDYFNTNEYDNKIFVNYIKSESRKRLIRRILQDKNIVQSLYSNIIKYPCKPKLENEEIEVFIGQILNKFYINHNKDSYNSIELLKIEDKSLKEIKSHISFKIKEEVLIKIKEIYGSLVENEELNQLLDSISVIKPFKQKEDLSKMNTLKDNLKSIIIENDTYYFFGEYKSLSTDTKRLITETWNWILKTEIYTMFNIWFKEDKVDYIFEKVYEKNKEEITKLLNENEKENNAEKPYIDHVLVGKIGQLIRNTTYSVLQDNKEYLIKNINQDSINKLDFTYISGYKEKEFVINALPEILCLFVSNYPVEDEKNILIREIKAIDLPYKLKNRLIHEMKSIQLPYKLKYKPKIETKMEIESYNYIDLLKKKAKIINSLNNNMKELDAIVNMCFNSVDSNLTPFTNKETSIFYKDTKDLISNLYNPLKVSIPAIEKQNKLYAYIDYIEKQKTITKEENQECWEEMIINYFECYNHIFNNMKDSFSSEVIEKIENSSLLDEYKQLAASLAWDYLLTKDEQKKQCYYDNLFNYMDEIVQKTKIYLKK